MATTSNRSLKARSLRVRAGSSSISATMLISLAVRYNEWKITFKTIVGNLFSGKEDSTNVPLVTNLRVDPWERYQTESTSYGEWWGKKLWVMMPATMVMSKFLSTFKDYPPSQVSGSLSVEKALQALQEGGRKN